MAFQNRTSKTGANLSWTLRDSLKILLQNTKIFSENYWLEDEHCEKTWFPFFEDIDSFSVFGFRKKKGISISVETPMEVLAAASLVLRPRRRRWREVGGKVVPRWKFNWVVATGNSNIFFVFTPIFGEGEPNLTNIVSRFFHVLLLSIWYIYPYLVNLFMVNVGKYLGNL